MGKLGLKLLRSSLPAMQAGGGGAAFWTRAAVPLISPGVAWEGPAVQEPSLTYESGTWKMWYTGAYTAANEGLGYATCSSDPTVPGNWTKYASNPVLGQGGSSVAGRVAHASIYKEAGTYYCFYIDGSLNMKVVSSADGIAWGSPTTILTSGSPAFTHGWANSQVWKEGSTYKMLAEASNNAGGGAPWAIAYVTATSITGTWTVQGGAFVTGLSLASYPSGYSGPNFPEINGTLTPKVDGTNYALWYHVNNNNGGFTVSDITHATSPDLSTWANLGIDLHPLRTTYEAEQTADPCVLEVNGKTYLFYSGVDNVTPASYINVATYPGTISQILTGG